MAPIQIGSVSISSQLALAPMHQRQLTEAIKRARQIALLPYVTD